MRHALRCALVAAALFALVAVPRARAADPVPADKAPGTATPYTATREPFPPVLLAPSFALEGIWMFDAARSDDPMKVMQAARPPGEARGGGMRFEGMGGGRGRGGRGGMSPGGDDSPDTDHADIPAENRPRGPSPMLRVMRPAKKLVIEMLADQVNISEDEHTPRPYAIEDSLKAHGRELLTENTSARWRSGSLEMTQTIGPRGKLVETYALSHDGKTLTIRAHREGGREGLPAPTITRIYTRYDGE